MISMSIISSAGAPSGCWRVGWSLASLASPATSMAAEAAKRYALERSGFLQLKVPTGWSEEIDTKNAAADHQLPSRRANRLW